MPKPTSIAPPWRGFTLIELLVTIGIIAILGAILFPVFVKARDKARQVVCASNLKQLGIALNAYGEDFDEVLPPSQIYYSVDAAGNPASPVSWPTLIYGYVKNQDVFVCPSGERSLTAYSFHNGALTQSYCGVTTNDGTVSSLRLVHALSYARNLIPTNAWTTPGFNNNAKTGFVYGTGTTDAVSLAQVEDPAGTIQLVDAWTTATSQGSSIRGIQEEIRTDHFSSAASYLTASKVARRHSEGFVALQGDGHVKWWRWGSSQAKDWSIQSD